MKEAFYPYSTWPSLGAVCEVLEGLVRATKRQTSPLAGSCVLHRHEMVPCWLCSCKPIRGRPMSGGALGCLHARGGWVQVGPRSRLGLHAHNPRRRALQANNSTSRMHLCEIAILTWNIKSIYIQTCGQVKIQIVYYLSSQTKEGNALHGHVSVIHEHIYGCFIYIQDLVMFPVNNNMINPTQVRQYLERPCL